MNPILVIKGLGLLLIMLAVSMLVPLGVACFYEDGGLGTFSASFAMTFCVGAALLYYSRHASGALRNRGAFLLVSLGWFSAALFGALPLYLSGTYQTFIDAFFESASGFTTTGATVLAEVESLPHAILIWRSLTQFLGGMGIIVLSLAVLPLLGVGGMDLYRAEAPGPSSEKISARVSQTARALWIIYVFLWTMEVLVLWLLGMSLFDAVNHGFTTMATGGFSTRNESIGAFNSPAIEMTITAFMFLAGVNFLLHYRVLLKGDLAILKDREFRFYSFVVASAILLITASLWRVTHEGIFDSLRYAAFQVVSIISTTGYGTTDYCQWSFFPQALLLMLMIIGGCSGSTGGGIKCVRAMMLIKQGYRELCQMVHPKAVLPLKLGKNTVPRHITSAIFGFFFLYALVLGITWLVLTGCGLDLVTAFSGTLSALSNVGPALGDLGPILNYGPLPDLAKVMLSFCMIIGRLEVLTVLVLFTKDFWSS